MSEPNQDHADTAEEWKKRFEQEREGRIQAEEAARQAEEVAKQEREGRRQAEEVARQAEEVAEQERERAKQSEREKWHERAMRIAGEEQARRDVDSFRKLLQQEKADRADERQGQTLRQYLSQMSRVTSYLPRLLMKPATTTASDVSISSRISETTSVPEAPKTKKPNFTSGRTDIGGKHYPLRLCPWPDFAQRHEEAWARIEAAIGQERRLPSSSSTSDVEDRILELLPISFLSSPFFLTEAKTSYFLHETLQRPAGKILTAYFAKTGKVVYFDNLAAAVRAESPVRPVGSGAGSSDKMVKTHPDCVVLRSTVGMDALTDTAGANKGDSSSKDDGGGDGSGDNNDKDDDTAYPVNRFAVGEHKAARRLREADVKRIIQGPLPEDYMVTLAEERRGRRASGDASTAATSSAPPNQVYFAYALTQAYHYLLMSGLEYGYLASGETLTFLHIPEDDCTTLLYHVSLFPVASMDVSLPPPPAIDPETAEDAVFRQMAISQLCSLCLLADESRDRPRLVPWRARANLTAPKFPKKGGSAATVPNDTSQPPSIVPDESDGSSSEASSAQSGSSLGKRRRDDDDGGDDNDNGGGAGTRGRLAVRTHQPRVPSPLQQHDSSASYEEQPGEAGDAQGGSKTAAHAIFASLLYPNANGNNPAPVRQRKYSYCTQACLLGLMRGDKLDPGCPNVSFHRNAATSYNLAQPPHADRHPIRKGRQLADLVRLQLANELEHDCTCLVDMGYDGAIGTLFKLTLTGFGYTFVGKGVEAHHYGRLVHETKVYRELSELQGRLIPVHLGLIKLDVEYPMVNFKVVSHMMLLSYAGLALHSQRLQRYAVRQGLTGVDWDAEAERTEQELAAAGLIDEDDNINMMWCADTQRAMRIDFDHAYVVKREDRDVKDSASAGVS